MQRPWLVLFIFFLGTLVVVAQVITSTPPKLTMNMVMTSQELQETGVASLSPDQRKVLDDWLNRYTIRILGVARQLDASTHEQPKASASRVVASDCTPVIESQIDGDFNGWDGDTVFKLMNGQIWEQDEYDYDYEYDYMPDVMIYPTQQGCRMKVGDMDDTILVKRLK